MSAALCEEPEPYGAYNIRNAERFVAPHTHPLPYTRVILLRTREIAALCVVSRYRILILHTNPASQIIPLIGYRYSFRITIFLSIAPPHDSRLIYETMVSTLT